MNNLNLTINFPACEYFDNNTQRFIELEPITLTFEHSLYAISKWEAKTKKPFFPNKKDQTMSSDELLFYIACMQVEDNVTKEELIYRMNSEVIEQFKDFIEDKMSATWFNDARQHNIVGQPSRETVTSEMIYFYMFSYGIPKECEHWPINRLTNLIRIFSIKNDNKPMPKREEALSRTQLNKARRAALHSKG